MPLAFLDVETTGLNAWTGDRVCEVAIVRCVGKHEVDRLVTLVNPTRHISAGAAAVNGISDAMVADAPPFEMIASHVAGMLDCAVVVAHNAPFDLSFIRMELRLAGLPHPDGLALDTLILARRYCPGGSHSLGAVARRLRVRTPGHRALADVLTTREVFWRLVESQAGARCTLGDALRLQGWREPPVEVESPEADVGAALDLLAALRGGRLLRVVYRAQDGRTTERTIEPITVVDQGDDQVVVAYCHLRQAERNFIVSRIVSWSVAAAEQPSGRSIGGD